MYNTTLQGEVSELSKALEDIEIVKAKGATIRSKVNWKQVGDKCTLDFFQINQTKEY